MWQALRLMCFQGIFSFNPHTKEQEALLVSFTGEEKKAPGEIFSKITQLRGDGADT